MGRNIYWANMRGIVLFLAAAALDMTKQQADMTAAAMLKYRAPDFSAIVDGVQRGTYAFTEMDSRKAYINYAKFLNAPNSLMNVLHHEIMHLRGREHNNLVGDIMSYRLAVDSNGAVVNDAFVWP